MKKKIILLSIICSFSLYLFLSCEQDITSAEENKIVMEKSGTLIKSKYTECSIYLGNYTYYYPSENNQNANLGYKFINTGNTSDNFKRLDFINLARESFSCEHMVSKVDSIYWSETKGNFSLNYDLDKKIFKSIKYSYSKNDGQSATAVTNHSGFNDYQFTEFILNNIPFEISKDSTISVSLSGSQIGNMIAKYYYKYSSTTDNILTGSHTDENDETDKFVANDSTILKIIIK